MCHCEPRFLRRGNPVFQIASPLQARNDIPTRNSLPLRRRVFVCSTGPRSAHTWFDYLRLNSMIARAQPFDQAIIHPMLKYIIFDLDETLYPRDAGLMQEIGHRIHRYLIERVGLSADEAKATRLRYYQQYGTALRGLMVEYPESSPEDYLEFVHDIVLTNYIGPNPELKAMLQAIPLTRVILTNATGEHARKVLDALGIANCFSDIVDIRAIDYISKPNPHAYRRLLDLLQAQGEECILVEDSARNLLPAKALGMKTILVDSADCAEVDCCVKDILGVKDAVEKLMQVACCQKPDPQ